MGSGYKLGIGESNSKYIILSADDLPFGFTDIEAFLALNDPPKVVIGSKYHPRSELHGYSLKRRLMSKILLFMRYLILGQKKPLDSQGSLIVEKNLAKMIADRCLSDDYLFSLEFITYAIQQNETVLEVPIVLCYDQLGHKSTVRPFRDGMVFFWRLMFLKKHLRCSR